MRKSRPRPKSKAEEKKRKNARLTVTHGACDSVSFKIVYKNRKRGLWKGDSIHWKDT